MITDYPKKKLNYKPEGRRIIGKPQTRWGDDSGREEQAKGLSLIIDDDEHSFIKYFFFYRLNLDAP